MARYKGFTLMDHSSSKKAPRWQRIGTLALACCLLAAVAVVDGYRQTLGFPDGFVSPLDRTQQVLALVFMGISLAVSVWLGVLSWRALTRPIAQQLGTTIVGYTLFVVLLTLIALYLRASLDHGAGG